MYNDNYDKGKGQIGVLSSPSIGTGLSISSFNNVELY